MLPWQIWLIISGICFILEIATVGFLIFWFGVAALITCLLSLVIHNIVAQTTIFIILSIALIALTRPFANKISKKDNTVTNSSSVIGKEGIVIKEINTTPGEVGQVKVSGDTWSAIVNDYKDIIPAGSTIRVLGIEGVKLIIEPINMTAKSEILKNN